MMNYEELNYKTYSDYYMDNLYEAFGDYYSFSYEEDYEYCGRRVSSENPLKVK